MPSVISARSMVGATCSGSSCGGASAIRRNPSRPFLVNHSRVASESAMGSESSSSLSVRFSERRLCSMCFRGGCALFVYV